MQYHYYYRKEVSNMKLSKSLGMILLGIWLIVTGILAVFSIAVPAFVGIILGIVAIVAGLLLLFGKG